MGIIRKVIQQEFCRISKHTFQEDFLMDAAKCIENGQAFLGIEFGSTRIKAVIIDDNHKPIAEGGHEWELS